MTKTPVGSERQKCSPALGFRGDDIYGECRMGEQTRATLMETETRESPAVAARLVTKATARLRELGEQLRVLSPRYALAAGRGSSDAAALLAKYLFEARLGLPTVSAAPSIRSIYGRQLNIEKALVLAISQSGRSPDLVEFCRSATGTDVLRVGMINDETSPLAEIMDAFLPLEAGPEKSVAATKSCIAAMTLVFGLVAHWRNDPVMIAAFERAPDVLAGGLGEDWAAAEDNKGGGAGGSGSGGSGATGAKARYQELNAKKAEELTQRERIELVTLANNPEATK